MKRALVLGGADGVWEEAAAARRLADFDVVIATNHAGRDYEGWFDHWVSLHPELIADAWLPERRRTGQPDPGTLWSGIDNGRIIGRKIPLPFRHMTYWGGSSGGLAAQVALEVVDGPIVLAGVPMLPGAAHYDRDGAWRDAEQYYPAWRKHLHLLRPRVRSMSGWTAEHLGEPTTEWLASFRTAPLNLCPE